MKMNWRGEACRGEALYKRGAGHAYDSSTTKVEIETKHRSATHYAPLTRERM